MKEMTLTIQKHQQKQQREAMRADHDRLRQFVTEKAANQHHLLSTLSMPGVYYDHPDISERVFEQNPGFKQWMLDHLPGPPVPNHTKIRSSWASVLQEGNAILIEKIDEIMFFLLMLWMHP